MKKFFSSESVTEGHPDKVCDCVADAILDAILREDPNGRVACEVSITKNVVFIFGEITTTAKVDYEQIARQTICDIGYDHDALGFNGQNVKILVDMNQQSPDIALGVNANLDKEQGAGDQGIMFGYANNETENYMPLAIDLAHKLAKRLEFVRKEKIISGLRPDGKTQVTVEYDQYQQAKRIDTVVLSTQHDPNISLETLKKQIKKEVFDVVLDAKLIDQNTKFLVNPTGKFVIGGPAGDSGVTGRKIIVDTYGGYAHHGGGAFSGKDASKVDRSASYMARYIAKNIVASKLADECEIQLAYAIGVSQPVSIYINTFSTEKKPLEDIYKIVLEHFDLSPAGIIRTLDLKYPRYRKTTVYGHFGKSEENFPWERTDMIAFFK